MGKTAMKTKAKEIRTKPDFTLPCPQCGVDCQPEDVTKVETRKLKTPTGDVLVLPKRSLELICENCNFELQLSLDEDGNPIPYN